jgi:hypothetical protein
MDSPVQTANISYGCEDQKDRLCEGDTYETYTNPVGEGETPPWIKKDADVVEFEQKRTERIKAMRNSKVYKFVMLLSGFTNEKMSKFWTRNTGTVTSKGSADTQKEYHGWYINTDWADGMVYLTPVVYAHMEEALTAITQRHRHLREAKLFQFIESPRIRSIFARMVAMCYRLSTALSGHKYSLDGTYKRVNMERQRLMNVFKHVHLKPDIIKTPSGTEMGLVYDDTDLNPTFVGVNVNTLKADVYTRLALSNTITQMNRSQRYLN